MNDRIETVCSYWALLQSAPAEAASLAESIVERVRGWEREEGKKLPLHRIEALSVEAWHAMTQGNFAESEKLFREAEGIFKARELDPLMECFGPARAFLLCRFAHVKCYTASEQIRPNYSEAHALVNRARDYASSPEAWAYYLHTHGIIEMFADDTRASARWFGRAVKAARKVQTESARRTVVNASGNLSLIMARSENFSIQELKKQYLELQATRYNEPTPPSLVPIENGIPAPRFGTKRTPEDAVARQTLGIIAGKLVGHDDRYARKARLHLLSSAEDFEEMGLPMHSASVRLDLAHFYLTALERSQWAKAAGELGKAMRLTKHEATKTAALEALAVIVAARGLEAAVAKFHEIRPLF